jgi:hypothetical protein
MCQGGDQVVATVGAGLSRCRARSGDSLWSMWTTVQCIHAKQVAVRRNRTKKVELGKPDHTLV